MAPASHVFAGGCKPKRPNAGKHALQFRDRTLFFPNVEDWGVQLFGFNDTPRLHASIGR